MKSIHSRSRTHPAVVVLFIVVGSDLSVNEAKSKPKSKTTWGFGNDKNPNTKNWNISFEYFKRFLNNICMCKEFIFY